MEKGRSAGDDSSSTAARGVERVLDAVFLLADFDLASTTNLDDSDSARDLARRSNFSFSYSLEVFSMVVSRSDTRCDGLRGALAVKDDGVVLGHSDLLGDSEHVDSDVLELETDVLADDLTASHDGKILHVGLAVVAKAGALTATTLSPARSLLTTSWREPRLRRLSDDHEGLLLLDDALENATMD